MATSSDITKEVEEFITDLEKAVESLQYCPPVAAAVIQAFHEERDYQEYIQWRTSQQP